jgi:hypothetical protein
MDIEEVITININKRFSFTNCRYKLAWVNISTMLKHVLEAFMNLVFSTMPCE